MVFAAGPAAHAEALTQKQWDAAMDERLVSLMGEPQPEAYIWRSASSSDGDSAVAAVTTDVGADVPIAYLTVYCSAGHDPDDKLSLRMGYKLKGDISWHALNLGQPSVSGTPVTSLTIDGKPYDNAGIQWE